MPATAPAPPPPRGASYCFPPNITGVSASYGGNYYVLRTAAYYWTAVTTCRDSYNGRLVQWQSFEEQYAVEQALFRNQTAIQEYWLGGMGMFQDSKAHFRWTDNTNADQKRYVKRGDMWDRVSETLTPWAQDSGPYVHWGEGEPSVWGLWATFIPGGYCYDNRGGDFGATWVNGGSYTGRDNRCMAAQSSMAYSTVGPNMTRVSNSSKGEAWGWARADCYETKPYICIEQGELPRCHRGFWEPACALELPTSLLSCPHKPAHQDERGQWQQQRI